MPGPTTPPAELYARDEGSGPTILLLHGGGGDHRVWNSLVGPLSPSHRVIAPDLRGHGRSPLPAGSTMAFPELERDLLSLMESRQTGPTHLVGLSAGGFLALSMVVDHPDRVLSLTLIGSSGHCDAHTRSVTERWIETLRTDGFDAYVLRLLKDLFYPEWIEAHLDFADELREEQRKNDLRALAIWSPALKTFDLRPRLGRIRTPTLIIQGIDDRVVDPSHGRLLRQSIPGAELRLFKDTGHLVPIERPTETIGAIREFLAKHPGEAGTVR